MDGGRLDAGEREQVGRFGAYLVRLGDRRQLFDSEVFGRGEKRFAAVRHQVIGWDPRTHRIRSWMFDSDGSFGESVWARDENRWIVKHTGTLADGSDASVTHIVTPVDADTVTVQSKDHVVNGEKQPDLPEVKLTRRPAKEEPKPGPSEPQKPPKRVLPQ